MEFSELGGGGGGEAGGGDAGGGDAGAGGEAGGGEAPAAEGDVGRWGGGEAGGVVPAAAWVTLTMRGTVIKREPPGPDVRDIDEARSWSHVMLAVLTVTLTVSSSVVMVLLLP